MPVNLRSQTHSDEGDEARIEVIPLIDIMFFLLAAFMLVSLSMTHLKRVPIQVPEASTGITETESPPVQISIDASGAIRWESILLTPSEVTARLKTLPSPSAVHVMISADEEARHKHVIGVLNAVRAAGVSHVNFETREP